MAIDVTTMTNAAIEAAKNDAYLKAQSIVNDVRARTPSGEDMYNHFGDDKAKLESYLADCDLFEAEITRRKSIDGMEDRIKAAFSRPSSNSGPSIYGANDEGPVTYGTAFLNSKSYQEMFDRTNGFRNCDMARDFTFSVNDSPMNRKALITSGSAVGGPFVVPYYDLQYEPVARATPVFADMVSRVSVDTDTVYWVRQDTRSSAASTVGEASNSTGTTGTKPEATLAFSRQTSPVETLAVVAAVTERELGDASQMRAIIDQDLRDDLLLELDNQLLSGNGTSPNLTGILNAGIQTVACTTAFANAIDCMLRAQVVIMTANEPAPDGCVLNPLDWEPMRTAKASTSGEYLWGAPGDARPQTLWSLPVLVTNQMTANTGLVGAFRRACRLYDREQIRVVVGWINDDLYRNIVRIRMEMRVAFAVRRPAAIARVTAI